MALCKDPASPPDGLRVLYRDAWLAAVYKPSGLAVHPSPLVRDAPTMLIGLRDLLGQPVFTVHRLDRPTSGLMLVALDTDSARQLCQQFRDQRVAKTYLAVVRGWPDAAGAIDYPVPTAGGTRRLPARSRFRRLATVELPLPCGPYTTSRYALMELQPETGRYHQLRRHLKHLAHPVIGDTEYGDSRHNRLFRQHFGLHRLLLQSVRLRLEHPQHGRPLELSCPPDQALVQFFPNAAEACQADTGP